MYSYIINSAKSSANIYLSHRHDDDDVGTQYEHTKDLLRHLCNTCSPMLLQSTSYTAANIMTVKKSAYSASMGCLMFDCCSTSAMLCRNLAEFEDFFVTSQNKYDKYF